MGDIKQYDSQGNLIATMTSSGRNVYRDICHVDGNLFLAGVTNATAGASYVILYESSGTTWNAAKVLVTLPSTYLPYGLCWVDDGFYSLFYLSSLPPVVYFSRHTPDGAFMYTVNVGDNQIKGLDFDGSQFFVADNGDSPDQLEKIDVDGSSITLMNNGVACPADGINDLCFADGQICAINPTNIYHFHADGGSGKSLGLGGKGLCVVGDFIYVAT